MTDSTDTTTGVETKPKKVKSREEIEGRKDLARALLLCVLAVVVVRSFLFEPFKIPSSSMVPTLHIGDHIFVSKFNYGLSIPFTKIEFVEWGTPKRGEIIVFLFPRDESLHYIKRVVGIPGDVVEFRGEDLFINDELVKKEIISDPEVIKKVTGMDKMSGELYKETLGDSVHYVRYSKRMGNEFARNRKSEVIPEGHFFVAGDNRDDSYDSRSWGYVPRENIKGKAQMIWMSLDQEKAWGKLSKVRWFRCGTLIY
jgi:signal peptidase I